jgi:DNA-binding transcriptional MerR regulator
MMATSSSRLLTIKEVSQRTGLSTQLIRKWEERYDAVQPERFGNGYRGYTSADVDKLLWLRSRVDGGVPIGMAVVDYANMRGGGSDQSEKAETLLPSTELDAAKSEFLDLFLRMDAAACTAYFDALIHIHPIDTVMIHILQPVLVEIGVRWELGEASEYQEHFASQFIREKILAYSALLRPEPDLPTLFTACLPNERHEIGLLYFNYFALKQGYPIVYLGPSPSEKGILDCIRHQKPKALLFSVATIELYRANEGFLQMLDEVIKKEKHLTKVFLGGRVIKADRITPGTDHIVEVTGDIHATIQKIRDYLFG